MARIDSFLAQLVAYEAEALLIESGDNLYLVKGEQRLPLMQVRAGTIQNAHVAALLTEIAPQSTRASIDRCEPVAWDYTFGNCTFRCELYVVDGRFRARIRDVPDATVSVTQDGADAAAEPEPAVVEGEADEGRSHLEVIFEAAVVLGASDVHLSAGRPPAARIDGEMTALPGMGPLDPYALQRMIEEILPPRRAMELEKSSDTDFTVDLASARLRCNVFRDVQGVGAVFRIIPREVPTLEAIGAEALGDACALANGIVVVSGTAGAGKSTTIAAMVDRINSTRAGHIVTVEDPVECVHAPKRCTVNQRQLHDHTESVARALRAAEREDPDVVVVGELRDADALAAVIEMAEMGWLVVVGVCAPSPAAAFERLVALAAPDREVRARASLEKNVRVIIGQRLERKDGGGRTAVFDVVDAAAAKPAAAPRVAALRALSA